ncbi:MAG: ATP-binding cassette domain-containing protein [Chloroflexota bacterium]|nr:ATP-binding cassette domain-containing protein [Chloroflexota bacterium]
MRDVSKAFGHVQALDGVDLEVRDGEVLALVGDNGAGKSTLVKILSGVEQPDAGEIQMNGTPARLDTPADAQRCGIATVYQDLALVDQRSVAANIYLGREPRRLGILIDYPRMHRQARDVLKLLRINIPAVTAGVRELSGGQRQAVAIARALARQSSLLILDVPTAALGVEQTANVTHLIADLRAHGKAVLIISHNMEHVFEVADRISVLRHGRRVATLERRETSREEIVGLITGAIQGVVAPQREEVA